MGFPRFLFIVGLSILAFSAGLSLNAKSFHEKPTSKISRRHFLDECGLAAAILIGAPTLTAADAEESTVPLTRLISGLTTAPRRTIVITGANSGVGLAGARLLTAAGHRVICACRNQVKNKVEDFFLSST